MTVLQNTVLLENDKPARLHFTDHLIEPRTVTERATGRPIIRETLVMNVDRLDGHAVAAVLTTMASGLADQFEPYLKDKSYRNYEIIITQHGDGFLRKWTVQFIPLVAA